jgi:hypothetical protein
VFLSNQEYPFIPIYTHLIPNSLWARETLQKLPKAQQAHVATKSVRAAGRATSGVKLLDLDPEDKVAAAMVIPPEDPKTPTENGALIQ